MKDKFKNLEWEDKDGMFDVAIDKVLEGKLKDKHFPLLRVKKLCKYFPIYSQGFFRKQIGTIKAVDNISFDLMPGETMGLVGESGCGKTTAGRAILRAIQPTSGEVHFDTFTKLVDLCKVPENKMKSLRTKMQMIFQDPYSSLNPRMTVAQIVSEPLVIHKLAKGSELEDRVVEMLEKVGLKPEHRTRYPHAFSGGQRQRIGIARALIMHPSLVVCDEAVSALDVSVQAQVINLLQDLQEDLGLTYIFIAHNLNVVRHICDDIAVMYAGKIVELGKTEQIFEDPRHPYTKMLLTAVPNPDPDVPMNAMISGEVPDIANLPPGCSFQSRCEICTDACKEESHELLKVGIDHFVACKKQTIGGNNKNKECNLMSGRRSPAIEWWREARFGMFIHWGLYAALAGEWKGRRIRGIGEWIMYIGKIPLAEYAATAREFNPVEFDADLWARLAKETGMKYLVITAKHHDGFCMYHSEKPYNIVDDTPFGRDPMKELAAACHKYGIRLCFYYSQDIDWHAPGGGKHWDNVDENGRQKETEANAFAHYLEDKVKPQLRELLSNYGSVGLIWFDVPATITKEQSLDLCEFVHSLQPDCLVSGRVGHDCGDYGSLGDNQIPAGPVKGDWETPATLNDTWGFKADDNNWKTSEYLLRLLVQCASKGVNYLLNIGPDSKGVIPAPSIDRLKTIGAWLKINGESIYGSSQCPFPCDFPWGRVTVKKGNIYLHLFQWPGRDFAIAGLRSKVNGARLLADGRELIPFTQETDLATGIEVLRLHLPPEAPDQYISVIALDIDGFPEVNPMPVQQPDGNILLPAYLAEQAGMEGLKFERGGYVGNWKTPDARMKWAFRLQKPGRYRVLVQTVMDRVSDLGYREREGRAKYGDHRMRVELAGGGSAVGLVGRKDMIMDESVNRWHTAESEIGTVEFPGAGDNSLILALEAVDSASELGPTVSGVRLIHA